MQAPPPSNILVEMVRASRSGFGARPPAGAIPKPGPGQESVWDYPRPPRVEPVALPVRVEFGGTVIAATSRALRVVETAGAPCYYVTPDDCDLEVLHKTERWTVCEWKGAAFAYDVVVGARIARAGAWSYPDPLTDLQMGYERIAGWFAFYAGRIDGAWIGEERVTPQPGGFYGGWVTRNLTGPIKGEPGSSGW